MLKDKNHKLVFLVILFLVNLLSSSKMSDAAELDDHETYVSEFWNKGSEERSFDNMEGFKIQSTDEDYIEVIQDIIKMIRVKESVTIVNGISFKCTRAIVRILKLIS